MTIEEITDTHAWDAFFLSRPHTAFLQSWQWGEFQKQRGNSPIRMAVTDADQSSFVQAFRHRFAPGLPFVYMPRAMSLSRPAWTALETYLKERYNAICIRAEMEAEGPLPESALPGKFRQPSDTLLIDLSDSEDALLGAMHAKTRYNIHLARRKGVRIEQKKDIHTFWKLNQETTGRDGFVSYDASYYRDQLALPMTSQWNAYLGDTCIASNICIAYGDTWTYLHGASSNMHRNVMAPYLLQWEQICAAKKQGQRWYDFWGIARCTDDTPQTAHHGLSWDATDRLTGVTRFKAGFGGSRHTYHAAIEIPLRPTLYQWVQRAKQWYTSFV